MKLSFIPYKKVNFILNLINSDSYWFDDIQLEHVESTLLSEEMDRKLNKLINTEFNKEINH